MAVKTYTFNGYHFDCYDSLPPFPTASQTFPVKYCKRENRERLGLATQYVVLGLTTGSTWEFARTAEPWSYPDTESGSAFYQDPQAMPAR